RRSAAGGLGRLAPPLQEGDAARLRDRAQDARGRTRGSRDGGGGMMIVSRGPDALPTVIPAPPIVIPASPLVISAKAGIPHGPALHLTQIPACAGMTHHHTTGPR